MIRVSRVMRQTLACVLVSGSVLLSLPSQAADETTWKHVKETGVLRCGAAVSPPYTMRDPKTGEYSGVFSDLCRQFGEQVLKVKVEFVDTNWDNIVAGLQSEKWDVSMSLNDTPERRKAISFTRPAVDYSVTFAYNKNNSRLPKQINSLADLDKPGINITVMSGTVQDKAISAVFKQATIMRLPGFDETRMALMAKRADLLADDSMTNLLLTSAHPDWAQAFTPNPLLAQQGINFGVRKNTPEADIAEFNRFLDEQAANGGIDSKVKASVQAALASK